PTGAGDSFAGGFLGWVARCGRTDGGMLQQAMACGTTMASLAIEDFSPRRLAETGPEEIARRVALLHRMVHFDLEPLSYLRGGRGLAAPSHVGREARSRPWQRRWTLC
ncbi:MAG: hypothetical protein E4H17_04225, partial [Gemmatimonadales bacterium]